MLDRPSERGAPSALSDREIHIVLGSLILVMFIGSVEQAIVGPALPAMGNAFGRMGGVSWIAAAYLLASTPATLIAGTLSDIFGRRRVLLVSLAIFFAASILCSLANSLPVLIIGRLAQGVGGGGLLSLPNTIVADIVSPRERGRYQAYISVTYAAASLAGPILGGFMTQAWSWRAIFWAFVPLTLLAFLFVNRTLRRLPLAHHERRRFDAPGAALMTCTMIGFLFVVQPIDSTVANFKGFGYLLGMVTLALGIAFIFRELRCEDPLLPIAVLGKRVAAVTSLGGFLVVAVNASISAYLPLYYETHFALSPSGAGAALAAPLVGVVAGAYVSGQYMRRGGSYRGPPVVGAICGALAYLAIGSGFVDDVRALLTLTFAAGFGAGACLPAMLIATQNSVAWRDMGVATALHICCRSLGGTVGVALSGNVILSAMSGVSAGDAFQRFFIGCACTMAIAWFILAFLLPDRPLRPTAAAFEEAGEI